MKGQRIGYVRVSTFDQNVDRQLDGQSLDRIFTDKASEGTAWKVRQTTLSENVRRTVDRGRGGPPSSNRDQPDHSLTSQHPDICDV